VISLSRVSVKPNTSQEIPVAGNSGRSRPHPDLGWEVGLTWLYHFLRLGLACIFVYAGFIKLLDPRAFAHAIAQYDLIPEGLLSLVAVGLPALELLAGLGLVGEVRGSLTTVVILLLIFLVVLGYAVWNNLDIDCGCFTADELKRPAQRQNRPLARPHDVRGNSVAVLAAAESSAPKSLDQ
jgi:uncharacterized membrane protein YphA (DoxX/SURF4 family)